MDWRRTVALALTAVTLSCSSARADEPQTPQPTPSPASGQKSSPPSSPPGWYLGASIGGVFPSGISNQNFTVQNAGLTATINQGFNLSGSLGVAGQVGYDFKGPRVEGEFLWQSFSRPSTNIRVTGASLAAPINLSLGGSRIDAYSFFVNGAYDFRSKSRISPFVGVGVGFTSLNASQANSNNVILQAPGLSASAFAYQAKLGLNYAMSNASDLYLQYRFNGTTGFNYGSANVTLAGATFNIPSTSGALSNSSIELGVRIRP